MQIEMSGTHHIRPQAQYISLHSKNQYLQLKCQFRHPNRMAENINKVFEKFNPLNLLEYQD